MNRLKGKVCLITGSGKGIGATTAEIFAKEGAIVELCDIDSKALKTVENEIARKKGRVHATVVDVSKTESVNGWVNSIMQRHSRIDVLFNNAGISAVGRIDEVTEELWNQVISVNLTGVYRVSKEVLPVMMKQRAGSVINMSSSVAEVGLSRRAAYAATKGAVLAMTKSMQVDYAKFGIRINALLPGTILTPFVKNYLKKSYGNSRTALQNLKKRQLADDLGTPEDVAWAAVYLASEESRYVMGSGLVVDGGTISGKPF